MNEVNGINIIQQKCKLKAILPVILSGDEIETF